MLLALGVGMKKRPSVWGLVVFLVLPLVGHKAEAASLALQQRRLAPEASTNGLD